MGLENNPYRRKARPAAKTANNKREQLKQRRLKARKLRQARDRRDEQLFDEGGEFNPQRYDSPLTRSATANRTDRRMFNKQGEINAVDDRDALLQACHLLNNVTKKNADKLSFYNPSTEPSMEVKKARMEVLAAALNDPTGEGFRIVGQELLNPIKEILDYEGFARKFMRVRKLGQSELFRIPKDVRAVAYVIGGDGETPESRINTEWIFPEEYKISSFPTVDQLDILQMNYDVLDRAQDTARQEIELNEDKAAIDLVNAASQAINTVTGFATLGVAAFEDVRYQVERHRLVVENFLINRQEQSDVVKTMSAAIDPVGERELLLAGYIGTIYGAQVLTTAGTGVEEVIPAGTFFATTGADYLGEMGIRQELMSEPFNKYPMGETVKGWAFFEYVGFGIPNATAVAKGEK
jgi:hypothetical protein